MKHFLSIADLTPHELQELLDLGLSLKCEWRSGGNKPVLKGKSLALVFMKPSLRTRISFEMGMVHLGGYAFYLSPNEIKIGGRESVPDVARVLSGYADGVVARVFEHQHILDLAAYATIPVINGLSDYNHPAQGLSDMFTILEAKGKMKGLRLAYVGDSNNVARSLMFCAMKLGMHMAVASPPGYTLTDEDVVLANKMAVSGASLELFEDPLTAVHDADIIYTDTWTSMGQEEETAQRLKVFPPFQVNQALVVKAKPDCLVMHCLPAHRGEEITDEVADGPNSLLFTQAENRMHAQKAILVKLMADA